MQTNSLLKQDVISLESNCLEGCPIRLPLGKKLKAGGFSLIEVILALGVVSFAFVALFGMLPIGLNAFNNSVDSTISAQIAEDVMSQLKQEKFSQLSTQFHDTTDTAANKLPSFFKDPTVAYPQPATGFYYDDQGNQLALVQISPPAGAINPITVPPTNYTYSAEVQIYYNSTVPQYYQPSQTSGTLFVSSGTLTVTNQQPLATAVITIRKISTPKVARVYTGYIDNNGL